MKTRASIIPSGARAKRGAVCTASGVGALLFAAGALASAPPAASATGAASTAASPAQASVQAQAQAAQSAHARGNCGTMGPGTGLSAGKGWVVSMVPGPREFRVRGGGAVHLTVARLPKLDFDAGRPYYIVVEKVDPAGTLEWRTPGQRWEPVATTFLYPMQR